MTDTCGKSKSFRWDEHLAQSQRSKIHFISLEKLMKLVETLPAVSVSSVVKVNGYEPHTLIYYHSNFIKNFSTNFIDQRYDKMPFFWLFIKKSLDRKIKLFYVRNCNVNI